MSTSLDTALTLLSIPSPSSGQWYLGPFPLRGYALALLARRYFHLLIGLLPRWGERAAWPPARRAVYVAAAARVAARRYLWRAARRSEVLTSDSVLRGLQERAARDADEASTAEELLLSVDVWTDCPGETLLDFLEASTDPAFWRVFHAYAVLGVPIAVIAGWEQAPIGTIYNRLRLARRDLRAAIGRRRASQQHPSRS